MTNQGKRQSRTPSILFLSVATLALSWTLVQFGIQQQCASISPHRELAWSSFVVGDYEIKKNGATSAAARIDKSDPVRTDVPRLQENVLSVAKGENTASRSATNVSEEIRDTQRRLLPRVAYVVTVTECFPTIIDGAAVLAESLRVTQQQSADHHHHDLIAIVHHKRGIACTNKLQVLGFQVISKALPFRLNELRSRRDIVGGLGCCGLDEYLKLYAYTFVDYDVVIHLDMDVIVLKPLNHLIDTVMHRRDLPELQTIPSMYQIPKKVDFLYTREYNTHNKMDPTNRLKNGVQGAFFVLRPNQTRFDDLLHILKSTSFHLTEKGWNRSGFGGYWGAAQIQGLFSYYYYLHPETVAELDHCRYNTLGTDLRFLKDSNNTCRTGEDKCEDCSITAMDEVYLGHLSSCLKPWWCQHSIWRKTPVCRALTQRWFELRRSVQEKFGLPQPSTNTSNRTEVDKRFLKKTFGFCQGENTENYVLLNLPKEKLSIH